MKLSEYVMKKQIWLTPAMYCAGAVILSIATFYTDLVLVGRFLEYIPSILLVNVELGKDIMGVLAAAILTMTTFTFSTVLVVLTTYTSQFSPRSPENFVHGKVTRNVLGIFLGGFVYASLSLLYMQDKTFGHEVLTPSIGILIAFFCVAAFAYYIHFVSSNVQVTALINKLTADAENVISNYRELQKKDYVTLDKWEPVKEKRVIQADHDGYVQFFDLIRLMEFAEKQDMEIEVAVTTGEYVFEGMPLLYVYHDKEPEESFAKFYKIGNERTVEQDLGYAVQKLMEVAIRAISPSLNDPNTANEILIRVGRLLGKMGELKTNGWVFTDSAERNRVLYNFSAYHTILYHTFYQISEYGKDDISVLSAMSESLKIAAKSAPAERYETLWNTQLYILDGVDFQKMKKLDLVHLQRKIDELAKATEQPDYQLPSMEMVPASLQQEKLITK
ncbi:DUF2254 domain-containing protein [Planococcus sp. CAU13]|uniref:DUF2254 domain-containing protein n=1 Tax=Planococcus sp. CAU13 TaxID=1541197 RepID=UPI00052FFABC|nr:DUF2254 domain-containing protein [Planococcus sp. CAU13]